MEHITLFRNVVAHLMLLSIVRSSLLIIENPVKLFTGFLHAESHCWPLILNIITSWTEMFYHKNLSVCDHCTQVILSPF